MSSEGPARKPTSEPPDVDSLMSRLDGESPEERPSDPGNDRRPSAAELLGGRGRRSKRGIRVPDDAVPAASPPSTPKTRSVPPPAAPAPPAAPSAERMLSAPSFLPEAVIRGHRIISVGGPASTPSSLSSPSAPSAFSAPSAEAPASAPMHVSEPTPMAPAVAAIAPGVLSSFIDPAGGSMPAFAPASDVRLAAAPAEGTPLSSPLPVSSVPVTPPRRSAPPPPPIRTPSPFASPFGPPRPGIASPSAPVAISPSAVSTPPPAPSPLVPPQSAPSAAVAKALGGEVSLPNLDAQVREALALLEREDFEATIDISVQVDEPMPTNGPQSSEESLADEELEVVERPSPSKKVVTAPTPPPRRAGSFPGASHTPSTPPAPAAAVPVVVIQPAVQPTFNNTLPSAAAAEPSTQPSIVVAAAASAVSGPVTGPAITTATTTAATPMAPMAPAAEPAEIRKKKRQWFEELFNDDFARTLPRLDPRFLEREVTFIEDALGCDKGATVLDLGCGPGEQAVALASRGYEVIGVDLSLAMLARASDEAAEKGQRINFLQGDMRDLTFDEAFDGIYCFNTTFGYFDDPKNAEVIQRIHKALRRGGRFLLDVVNRDYIAPRTPSMVWFEGDGCVCMDEVQLNGLNSRLVIKRTMMMEDGRQREIEYSIRLYALHELGKLLHDNGFRVAEVSGDTSTPGSYFGSESPRVLILAEKR